MNGVRPQALAALARRYPDDYKRIYQSIKDGSPIDEVTVAEWATQWMQIRQSRVRPGTWISDRTSVNWIVRTIGDKPLSGLQPSDLRAVYEAPINAGLSTASAERTWRIMRLLLRDAEEEGYEIPERTMRTRKQNASATVHRYALPLDDAKRILKVAMTRPDASRWVAALVQGTRPAEALGLRWDAIDLVQGAMRIEWQLKPLPYKTHRDPQSGFRVPHSFEALRLTGAYHLVRPKTAAGVRIVPLVPWLNTELAAWAAIAPQSPYGLVWPADDGNPRSAARDRADWYGIAEEAGVTAKLPDGTERRPLLYECRHTAATLLMASGVDETTLTAIVGHSSIKSTQAYLHTDEARKRAALETVGTQLGVTL